MSRDYKAEYAEKLKDPRWQKMRLKIMERDDFACQYCGENENTLHVHHVEYRRGADPWDYREYQLLTVCEHCHKWEHDYRTEIEEKLLSVLKIAGISATDIDGFACDLAGHVGKGGAGNKAKAIFSLFEKMVSHNPKRIKTVLQEVEGVLKNGPTAKTGT